MIMKSVLFAILLISCCHAFPQNDELPNPIEDDNQFPPEEIPETKTTLAEESKTIVSETIQEIPTTVSEEFTKVTEPLTTEQSITTSQLTILDFGTSAAEVETTVDGSMNTEETATTVEEFGTTVGEISTTVKENVTDDESETTNEYTTISYHTTTETSTIESNTEVLVTNESINKSCPENCECKEEGEEKKLIVDCSGNGLEEFPKPLDPNTTSLLLQNNNIPEIPIDVSELKKLKELNLNNNLVANIASGSLSKLPELVNLKLKNNKLEEFPNELLKSFGFSKLEELDLGGNEIKTAITPELLSHFKSLNLLVLPNSTPELVESMCATFKDSLKDVCNGSCEMEVHKCSETLQLVQKAIKDADKGTSPGTIKQNSENSGFETTSKSSETEVPKDDFSLLSVVNNFLVNQEGVPSRSLKPNPIDKSGSNAEAEETITEPPTSGIAQLNAAAPAESNSMIDGDVKVGATTASKTGGVDKSIIGLVVAGMILVVAVVTIKKNWGSIKTRFSSSPRANANGTTANGHTPIPEEVPLQDKNNPV